MMRYVKLEALFNSQMCYSHTCVYVQLESVVVGQAQPLVVAVHFQSFADHLVF